jgi:hypothetical protein
VGQQTLPAGDYETAVTEAGAGLRFEAKAFTIRPGMPTPLSVRFEPDKPPVVPEPKATADPVRRADERPPTVGPSAKASDPRGRVPAADQQTGVNQEGFVQRWLVLAPIPLESGQSGAEGLDKMQVKDEFKLKPKAGDRVKAGGKDLAWREYTCPEHLLDFNALLGGQTEDSVAYAVTFIDSPEELRGVKMKTGSDDQAKVFLNGQEVFKSTAPRPADKDQDTTEVRLRKGTNVLVAKVVNEKVDWAFCVRFTDKDDRPLTKLTAKTTE